MKRVHAQTPHIDPSAAPSSTRRVAMPINCHDTYVVYLEQQCLLLKMQIAKICRVENPSILSCTLGISTYIHTDHINKNAAYSHRRSVSKQQSYSRQWQQYRSRIGIKTPHGIVQQNHCNLVHAEMCVLLCWVFENF